MTGLLLPRTLVALLALAGAVLFAGCSRDDPATLLASARAYQAKGDHQAAIIQLRNALQEQPENGEARLMLGRSALVVGDIATAQKEFRKAFEFGEPDARVVPLIALSMLLDGAAGKVVADYAATKLDDPKAQAELRAIVGEAQLRLKDPRAASASFAEALASDPQSVRARLGIAQLRASEGKQADAVKSVEAILAEHPDSVDALLQLAQLKQAANDREGARAALKRAIEASPAIVGPRLHFIALLIEDHQFDAARAEVDAARLARAPDIALQYFEAQIALGRNDRSGARKLAQEVLKRAPSHVPALVLLGTLEFQERNYAQAESYLRNAVTLAPEDIGLRVHLARSYLASSQPQRALDVVSQVLPALERGARENPGASLVVGETYFANGDLQRAARFYEQASTGKAQQSIAQMRLGQIALASGNLGTAVDKLEPLTADDLVPAQGDMALVTGYVRQGNTDKALEVARGMVKKHPNDPAGHFAVASVLALRQEYEPARAAYQQALQVDPTYVPAAAGLAQFDLGAKDARKARGRFEAILAKEPKNESALLGLATVMIQTRAPKSEVVAVLQRAVAAAPGSARARLALIDFHLRNRDGRAALAAAQEAAAALSGNGRVLDALGRSQLAVGDTNQAIETYNRLATMEPQSPAPLLRLASIHYRMKEDEKAIDALLRAQKLAPSNVAVAQGLVLIHLRTGKPDEALKQARALQASMPKAADGFLLEGSVHRSTGQSALSEKAYRQALLADPGSEVAALRLHEVLLAGGKRAEADALSDKWLAAHPKAVTFRAYLGEQSIRAGDLKKAVSHYEAVVARQPRNADALNNLAWAMGQLGDAKALDYAERAVKANPNSPAALDTLGMLLVSKGYAPRGAEYLARAVELAPERHKNATRLNYAKALLKAGRKEDARKQLAELARVEEDFQGKGEVVELLKQ